MSADGWLNFYIWYGLKIGLTRQETRTIPLGELMDLVAVEQVKHEGARIKHEEDIFALLDRK